MAKVFTAAAGTASVMADDGALGRLLKFQKFADANEPDQLRVAVDGESMAPLHRLCTSGEGIDRALAGALSKWGVGVSQWPWPCAPPRAPPTHVPCQHVLNHLLRPRVGS